VSEELSLGRRLQAGRNRRDPDLRTLGIEIAAEALEVGAEVEYEPSERLLEERWVRRDGCEDRCAVCVDLVQARHTVILPADEGGGRRGGPSRPGVRRTTRLLPTNAGLHISRFRGALRRAFGRPIRSDDRGRAPKGEVARSIVKDCGSSVGSIPGAATQPGRASRPEHGLPRPAAVRARAIAAVIPADRPGRATPPRGENELRPGSPRANLGPDGSGRRIGGKRPRIGKPSGWNSDRYSLSPSGTFECRP